MLSRVMMVRAFRTVLFCALAGFAGVLLMQDLVQAQHIDELRSGVVKLSSSKDDMHRTGTGFVVRHDSGGTYIVTVWHVIEGDKFPKVEFFTHRNTWVETEVVQSDPRQDIAVLKVRNETQVPADVRVLALATAQDVQDNEELTVIGFPTSGGFWAAVRVTLASRDGIELMLSGGTIGKGNSGGPVLKNGRIIGLITEADQFGRALPAEIVTMVLKGWGIAPDQHSRQTTTDEQPQETRASFEPEMVNIPAGKFRMGSPETEQGRSSDEGPQHEVTISRPFALSRYEITVGQFRQFVEDAGYRTTAEKDGKGCYFWNTEKEQAEQLPERNWKNPGFKQNDDHPAVCVSWDDAQAYLKWLSQQTGKQYRLPTEAEWEYAARAGTTTARFYPDGQQCQYANGLGQEGKAIAASDWVLAECTDDYVTTAPVGRFKSNPHGLSDMLGNVWEWTQDCWHDNYNNAPGDGSAWLDKGGGDCSRRVVRGGSWFIIPQIIRSAIRHRLGTDGAINFLGFRIARDF